MIVYNADIITSFIEWAGIFDGVASSIKGPTPPEEGKP